MKMVHFVTFTLRPVYSDTELFTYTVSLMAMRLSLWYDGEVTGLQFKPEDL